MQRYIVGALSLLVLYCMVTSLTASICITNSLYRTISLAIATLILSIFLLLDKKHINPVKVELCISLIAIVLFLCSIPFYLRFIFTPLYVNLSDISQFRNLYAPLGILSNDWVGIQLLLLPFSLVPLIRTTNTPNNIQGKIHLIAVCLEVVGIVITMSRVGWICMILFFIILSIFAYKRIISKETYICISCVAIFSVILLSILSIEGIMSTVFQSDSHIASTNGRIHQLTLMKKMDMAHFLFGVGVDNFALYNLASSDYSIDYTFTGRAYSFLLKVITELGFLGVLIYALILSSIICFLYSIWKSGNVVERRTTIVLVSVLVLVFLKECSFSSITHSSCHFFLFLLPYIIYAPHTSMNDSFKRNGITCSGISAVCVIICSICLLTDNFSFEKKAKAGYDSASSLRISFSDMKVDKKILDIKKTLDDYQSAINKNSYDASFYHNIAWINYSDGRVNNAINNIKKAICLDKNNPMYYVVCGLFTESTNMDFAATQYTKAILLNPSICFSEFWGDFSSRQPKTARKCVNEVINEISPIAHDNPKRMAKLGILYYKNGNSTKARLHFKSALTRMPNLNRVWLYMYCLESDQEKKQAYLNRAVILNQSDNIPYYIKTRDNKYLKETTYYVGIKDRLYPLCNIEHNYLPNRIYSYIMTPCLKE